MDWLLGQQQFCLMLERLCCPQPAALGKRSVLGLSKTAVVLEPGKEIYSVVILPLSIIPKFL